MIGADVLYRRSFGLILKEIQQIQNREEIKKILAPTRSKIITTILLELTTVLASIILSLTAVNAGSNTSWDYVVRFLLLILNFGGRIGEYVVSVLFKTEVFLPGLSFGILYFGLTVFFQIIYLYLIISLYFYFKYGYKTSPVDQSQPQDPSVESNI